MGPVLADRFAEITIVQRVESLRPYEFLIFFTLAVLLALCIAVSRVVVTDVEGKQIYHENRGTGGV